jgi:S1-C subfamily serine protease
LPGSIFIAVAVFGCLLIALVFLLAALSNSPPASKPIVLQPEVIPLITAGAVSWTETVAERSERGVVQVRSGDALGTGFVVASLGHRHLIATNKHVLSEPDGSQFRFRNIPKTCTVITKAETSLLATIAALAVEQKNDVALLLVDSNELQTLGPIVAFSSVRVGEDVAAIGNPLGLDHSITKGIISEKRWSYLLQTDAAINHGNSGGPLVDQKGQVVGINTYSLSASELAAPGIGFAIRADLVLDKSLWEFRVNISDLMDAIPR